MISIRLLLAIMLSFSITTAYGQFLGFDRIDDANVNGWSSGFAFEYFGAYHFGDSEAESTLVIFPAGDVVIAQIISGEWNADATSWINFYRNLSNVKIDSRGRFYSDQYRGEFVSYSDNGKLTKCLKIYDSWSGVSTTPGEYELGYKLDLFMDALYPGNYVIASTQPLTADALRKYSATQLKIMRNEIFARYGYTFKPQGQMDIHFRQQNWYRPQHSNVNNFLTALEKANIKLIQAEEKSR